MSVPSKVEEWWRRNENTTNTPESYCIKNVGVLSKDLKTLLSESSRGKAVLEYASQNIKLTSDHRDDIINVIIEDILSRDIVLCTQDYKRLLDEICLVIPLDTEMKDFYYISRKGKNNASGKLYAKYRNKKLKKRKLLDSLPNSSSSTLETPMSLHSPDKELVEIDESFAVALKTSLFRECDNWGVVCEKWKTSFNIRQKDLQKLKSVEFLQEWPKLSDSRASELINIDFDIIYPLKGHLLLSKCDKFKEKIRKYYAKNNEYCKQLFTNLQSATSIDAQDYIYTILLNAVLPSPAIFKILNSEKM